MAIPQINFSNQLDTIGEIRRKRAYEDPVALDLFNMWREGRISVITKPGPSTAEKIDLYYVMQTIKPAFQRLYEMWPDAYNLLMKNKFDKLKLLIAENESVAFESESNGKVASMKYEASSQTININQFIYSKLNSNAYLESLYHEIMHAVSNFCGKRIKVDSWAREMGGHFCKVNKDFNFVLLSIYLSILSQCNKTYNKRIRSGKYKEIIDLEELDEQYKARQAKWFKRLFFDDCWTNYPHPNSEEFLVEGLIRYFGSEKKREELRLKEPKLVKLIEENVIPLVRMISKSPEEDVYIHAIGETPWRKKTKR